MRVIALPGVEKGVKEAIALVEAGKRRIVVTGRASAGKSTALSQIEQALSNRRKIVRARMPHGDDAGPVALAGIATQLGLWETIKDPALPWAEKVAAACDALRGVDRPIVMIDDAWLGSDATVPSFFTERASDLIGALAGLSNATLIVSARVAPNVLGAHQINLAATADATLELARDRWPSALHADAAQVLASRSPRLALMSPVELRLCVGLVARGWSVDKVLESSLAPRALVRSLRDQLEAVEQRALDGLALVRTAFDEVLLGNLLAGADADLFKSVFVFETEAGWVVPELLAREISARPGFGGNLAGVHRSVAQFHARRFAEATVKGDIDTAVSHEMEEVHHLTMAGDAAALLDRSLAFVEQYDALGKVLGRRGAAHPGTKAGKQELADAVRAYERALEHDPRDAYALHYLGYNLDLAATDAVRAEASYRLARAERPDHVWHQGRLISFLVTRGRELEARDAWDLALQALDGVRERDWLYKELHRPLARLLLHRGSLDFATAVLADVPPIEGDLPGWLRALRRLLAQLREAETDELVFPAALDLDQRWLGPHLARDEERELVDRWMPGRFELVDALRVVIRVQDAESKAFGRQELTLAALRLRCPEAKLAVPAAGTFVELVWFKGSKHEVIRCHPPAALDPELKDPFPSPDRYVRAASRPRS